MINNADVILYQIMNNARLNNANLAVSWTNFAVLQLPYVTTYGTLSKFNPDTFKIHPIPCVWHTTISKWKEQNIYLDSENK